MKTAHYFVTNLQEFSEDTGAVEKLKKYLQDIEGIFPTIEDVFGQAWSGNRINIKLDDSMRGAVYDPTVNPHTVKMKIYNKNIQKEYPENLWGCLFHETHHAFMNPVIYNKTAKKYLNGGFERAPFNRAFMAMTYLRLSEKRNISEQLCKDFLDELEREMKNDGGKELFRDYVDMFSKNTDNFSKFVSYLKSSDRAFTDVNNFLRDLDKARKFLMQ